MEKMLPNDKYAKDGKMSTPKMARWVCQIWKNGKDAT